VEHHCLTDRTSVAAEPASNCQRKYNFWGDSLLLWEAKERFGRGIRATGCAEREDHHSSDFWQKPLRPRETKRWWSEGGCELIILLLALLEKILSIQFREFKGKYPVLIATVLDCFLLHVPFFWGNSARNHISLFFFRKYNSDVSLVCLSRPNWLYLAIHANRRFKI
jgi:hypothetical protein